MADDSEGSYEGVDRFGDEVHTAAAAEIRQQMDGPCAEPIAQMAEKDRAVKVFGRVVDGKLEIDQGALEAFAQQFPDAGTTFVAVNAPFDPVGAAASSNVR